MPCKECEECELTLTHLMANPDFRDGLKCCTFVPANILLDTTLIQLHIQLMVSKCR